jgi:LacI family transcriptional regulator
VSHEKEITIYDIAKLLGISASTVSRGLKDHPAVNINTRKLIADTAAQLGYRSNNFATSLRKQRTSTIGAIIHELHSEFVISALAGIEKITSAAGYDLIIGHSSESMAKEVANAHNLFNKRVDGLIASLAYDTTDLQHFEPFFRKKIPVVFFDRVAENTPAQNTPGQTTAAQTTAVQTPAKPSTAAEDSNTPANGIQVVIDNFKAAYNATTHLIQQKCTRIAHSTANLQRNVYSERLRGYRQALEDNNLPYNPEWIFVNDQTYEAIRDMVRRIVNMTPRPDALFLTNDFCAAVAIQVLKELGLRIPHDIAIVGFNNDTISQLMEPRITTIDYPGNEIGEVAAQCLIDLLHKPGQHNLHRRIIIDSKLIIRASTLRT